MISIGRPADGEMSPLKVAQGYLAAGMSIVPIRPDGSKSPPSKWKKFQAELPTDQDLKRWWSDGRQGIALVCGAISGGRELIDFDRPGLFDSWQAMVATEAPGLVDRLPVVETAGGGHHAHYCCTEIEGNQKLAMDLPGDVDPGTGKPKKKTLIETRGEGGYALLPGSPAACHPSGRLYHHVAGPPLTEAPLITPGERETLLRLARSFDREASQDGAHKWRLKATGEARLPGDEFNARGTWPAILEPHGWTNAGQRGDGATLWRRPGKDDPGHSGTTGYCRSKDGSDLLAVFSANAHPFPGPSGRQPCSTHSKFDAYALLNHGGDYKAAARELGRQGYGTAPKGRSSAGGSSGDGRAPGEPGDRPHLTDRGNARRLVLAHGENLRYCHPWKKWLAWTGTHWRIDDVGAAMRMAMATVKHFYDEAAADIEVLKQSIDQADDPAEREQKTERIARIQRVLNFALKSEAAPRLNAMLELARSEKEIAVLPQQMDRDPWLFNCTNGTVNLRTGELREHRREDLITRRCPTAFRPDAKCPTFLQVIGSVLAHDEDLIGFLQRYFGYSMSADVREQILLVLFGLGSNGKTLALQAIQRTLGNHYATSVPAELLMEVRGEQHPTIVADLFGVRLAIASETEDGKRLNESRLKLLTGGDVIKARRMREDMWEFNPTHKLVLVTNHKPEVKGTDHGIWRRLALVPFNVRFWDPDKGEDGPPELRADKSLSDKLQAEAEGMLAWLVSGCLEWQRHGLGMPDIVRAATAEYRSDQDVLAAFLRDCCQCGSQEFRVQASALYVRYREWAESAGERIASQRRFGRALRERSFEAYTNNGVWYRGIGLCDKEPQANGSAFHQRAWN